NLCADTVISVEGLIRKRRRELIDVSHHLFAGHTVTVVDYAELVRAVVAKFIRRPVYVPYNFPCTFFRTKDGFYGILGELAEELKRMAIFPESFEKEASVLDGQGKRALPVLGMDGIHVALLSPPGGFHDPAVQGASFRMTEWEAQCQRPC